MDLCVIVLTTNIDKESKPPKVMPKVCFKIEEKSMIEICLENVFRLNPSKIILMISKHEILYINKIIKNAPYSKLVSYCVFDNGEVYEQKISLAKKCYTGKNVLVIPGNSPMLTTKSMNKILSENRNLKVNNSLFYLKKDSLNNIDMIAEHNFSNKNTNDSKFLTDVELIQVESRGQYDDMVILFKNKKK